MAAMRSSAAAVVVVFDSSWEHNNIIIIQVSGVRCLVRGAIQGHARRGVGGQVYIPRGRCTCMAAAGHRRLKTIVARPNGMHRWECVCCLAAAATPLSTTPPPSHTRTHTYTHTHTYKHIHLFTRFKTYVLACAYVCVRTPVSYGESPAPPVALTRAPGTTCNNNDNNNIAWTGNRLWRELSSGCPDTRIPVECWWV